MTRVVQHDVIWRQIYKNCQLGFGVATGVAVGGYALIEILSVVFGKKKGGR
jgi:hypothetical protein